MQSRKAVDEVLSEIYDYTTTSRRKLLVVEPDPARLKSLRDYLSGLEDVEVVATSEGAKAAELIRSASVDCAVVNPETPEANDRRGLPRCCLGSGITLHNS
jgi:DNA-binding NarL/FixJ family response regulator